MVFGSDRGRFYESKKRSVDNLNSCGPLIKTIMTRCIHCTCCVRFINEYSGFFDFGVIGRGGSMEIELMLRNFCMMNCQQIYRHLSCRSANFNAL